MAEKNNGISSVMESLLKGANALMSTKTVVGEATKIDDTIIVPLVDVSFGVGAGASCNGSKDGGAGGLSGKMTPSTKILDMIPDLVDKFTTKDETMMSDEEAEKAAFPSEDDEVID